MGDVGRETGVGQDAAGVDRCDGRRRCGTGRPLFLGLRPGAALRDGGCGGMLGMGLRGPGGLGAQDFEEEFVGEGLEARRGFLDVRGECSWTRS